MSARIKRLPSTGDLPEFTTLLWFGQTQPLLTAGQYFVDYRTGAPEGEK